MKTYIYVQVRDCGTGPGPLRGTDLSFNHTVIQAASAEDAYDIGGRKVDSMVATQPALEYAKWPLVNDYVIEVQALGILKVMVSSLEAAAVQKLPNRQTVVYAARGTNIDDSCEYANTQKSHIEPGLVP